MPVLNKAGLINQVAKASGVDGATVAKVIEGFEKTVVSCVSSGVAIKLVGFIAIEPMVRSARVLVNPKTNEKVEVPAIKTVRVRAMKRFKDNVAE